MVRVCAASLSAAPVISTSSIKGMMVPDSCFAALIQLECTGQDLFALGVVEVGLTGLQCRFRMIAREVSLYKHQARVLSMTGDINQHCPHFPCGRSCCRGLPYCTHFGSDIGSSPDQQFAHRPVKSAKARHSTPWCGRMNVLRWSSKRSIPFGLSQSGKEFVKTEPLVFHLHFSGGWRLCGQRAREVHRL